MAEGIYAVCSWSSHFGIVLKKLLVIFHSGEKTISVYGSKKPKCVIDAHSMVLYCHLFRLCINLLMLEAREVHVGVHVIFYWMFSIYRYKAYKSFVYMAGRMAAEYAVLYKIFSEVINGMYIFM